MTRRHILQAILAVAALTGLVLAWPAIASTARDPRVGEWVPTEDPGAVLTVQQDDRRYTLGIGEENWSCDIVCTAPFGYRSVDARLYNETDGMLGWQDEPILSRTETTAPAPLPSGGMAGWSGYRSNGHLLAEIEWGDGQKAKATVGPPMNFQKATETDWRPLAMVWDLGVLIEWRQTNEHLLIRRSALPDHAQPTWSRGWFGVGGIFVQFADDTQIAHLFRARIPSQPSGDQNVQVIIQVDESGISTRIRVK